MFGVVLCRYFHFCYRAPESRVLWVGTCCTSKLFNAVHPVIYFVLRSNCLFPGHHLWNCRDVVNRFLHKKFRTVNSTFIVGCITYRMLFDDYGMSPWTTYVKTFWQCVQSYVHAKPTVGCPWLIGAICRNIKHQLHQSHLQRSVPPKLSPSLCRQSDSFWVRTYWSFPFACLRKFSAIDGKKRKHISSKIWAYVGWTTQPVRRDFGFPNEKQTRRPMHYFLLAVVRIFHAAVVIASEMYERMCATIQNWSNKVLRIGLVPFFCTTVHSRDQSNSLLKPAVHSKHQ